MLFPFAFFCGVLGLLATPTLPPAWAAVPVGLLAIVMWVFRRRIAFASAVAGLCSGLLFAGYHAHQYLEARWPPRLADERVIASVVVDSIPAARESGWAFDAEAEIERPQTLARRLRVRLASHDASFRPRAGERWQLLLSLRPPQGRANPGTQDLARQLFRDGIHALGTVVPAAVNRRIDDGHCPLTALRERISRHIEDRVADRDAAALLAALAVGDTGRVSREQWRVFNVTGTTHLVAISGMHVTLFAVVAFAVARWLWSLCVPPWPRESFAALVGFVAAMLYALLAGLSVPTQRTLIMLGAWLFARASARVTTPMRPLAIALVAVLLVDPFAPLSAGFWLSFVAMGAIIAITAGRVTGRSVLREAVSVQAVVTIALIPFSLALFGSVSLIGPLVNVVAIPAMSWVLVPTVLLAVALLPISDHVLAFAAWLHDLGWPWLAAASDVPWALFHASPPWWWYALSIAAIGTALLPWPLRMRLAILTCLVPLAFTVDDRLGDGEVEMTVLDVGEGTAIVVRTATRVLVYGTGDSYGTQGRMAENVVVPFLRSRGVAAIDVLIVGQISPPAAEGVTALLAEMPVHQTFVDCADVGGRWLWEGVALTLSPDMAHACTLLASVGSAHFVVPGRGFSAAAYIEDGLRRWAVVSGRLAPRLARKPVPPGWKTDGAEVLDTDTLGAIQVRLHGARGGTDLRPQRADRRTLWAASP